ncbi:hypothetical protein HZS61_008602 [Fusarium oxysporum f. sp. conglutinans]|uniref:HTH CENPB-type domain-containing protein n=2 Tax=Fusarium oxysporum f. sp. conglutinans TaxID=100902 RepID=A0A8H6H3A8_FUSOX|nr:hypothetical protein HZS61_008602 [Fusarium oxysporum f. sp. conglutinans]
MPQLSYTEEDVIQAMLDITDNGLSQNQAAQKNGVPQTTLSDRLRGLPSRSEITQPAQLLSKSEESRLVTWILRQEALGYAPSHSQVRATVAALLRQQGRESHIGVHWLARFIKRHDDIKTKVGKRQEAARFNSFTPMAVNWYFDIRESEYGWIKPENTVNVDEGGIMTGFGLDSLVIGSSDPRRKAFLKGPQSRTWTTFIETVTADGRLLKPGIIFKDKELQQQWFIDELQGSPTIEWLKEVYLPQTQPADESDARLIILDGHGSHVSNVRPLYCSTLQSMTKSTLRDFVANIRDDIYSDMKDRPQNRATSNRQLSHDLKELLQERQCPQNTPFRTIDFEQQEEEDYRAEEALGDLNQSLDLQIDDYSTDLPLQLIAATGIRLSQSCRVLYFDRSSSLPRDCWLIQDRFKRINGVPYADIPPQSRWSDLSPRIRQLPSIRPPPGWPPAPPPTTPQSPPQQQLSQILSSIQRLEQKVLDIHLGQTKQLAVLVENDIGFSGIILSLACL